MVRKSGIVIASLLSLVAASGVAAPPRDVPTQRETLQQWYCGRCFSEYRRQAEECFEFWEGNDLMILRCLNGPRQDFLACIQFCPLTMPSYDALYSLYEDGLLDAFGFAEAIQSMQ